MAKTIVIYDDQCAICARQVGILRSLDWFERLEIRPGSDPRSTAGFPELGPEALQAAIHAITPANKFVRGARAVRHLSLRLPALWPLGILLWIPGMIWIAEPTYRLVAAHRYRLSRAFGCKDACKPREPAEITARASRGDKPRA
jgi:predicted DCC family thiol-disulfide oxidoreductase YuxK